MPPKEVTVSKLPPCDLHPDRKAEYDFSAPGMGCWMYGCRQCFQVHGVGLGVGKGQRLGLRAPEEPKP